MEVNLRHQVTRTLFGSSPSASEDQTSAKGAIWFSVGTACASPFISEVQPDKSIVFRCPHRDPLPFIFRSDRRGRCSGHGTALLIKAVAVVEISEKAEHFHIHLLSTE